MGQQKYVVLKICCKTKVLMGVKIRWFISTFYCSSFLLGCLKFNRGLIGHAMSDKLCFRWAHLALLRFKFTLTTFSWKHSGTLSLIREINVLVACFYLKKEHMSSKSLFTNVHVRSQSSNFSDSIILHRTRYTP